MYHIVDFLDTGDTEVVPASWVENGRSYWPPYKARERCNRAIMGADPPEESWANHNIRIRATKNTFSEARLLLPRALLTSDLQTEDEEDQRPAYRRRKRRGTNRIWDSESEDDSTHLQPRGVNTRAPLGLPPAPVIAPPTPTRPAIATSVPRQNLSMATPDRPRVNNQPTRPAIATSVPRQNFSMATPDRPRVNNQAMCDPILRDILTTMETIKHQQQMILLHLQTTRQPMEVPDVSGIPLTSLDELIKLEDSIASQVEYKRKLVCECSCIC
ncbi:uncharacterized protein LOC134035067 [Osmerus eperlanus]|uniref:uncharacterized protein LOC134035067 n=1 Tax=Osmerus eperlanus TaxID=29151 RepID=UPI002E14CAE1